MTKSLLMINFSYYIITEEKRGYPSKIIWESPTSYGSIEPLDDNLIDDEPTRGVLWAELKENIEIDRNHDRSLYLSHIEGVELFDIFVHLQKEKVGTGKMWNQYKYIHSSWSEEDWEPAYQDNYLGNLPLLPSIQRMNGATVLFITKNQLNKIGSIGEISYSADLCVPDEEKENNPNGSWKNYWNEYEIDEVFMFDSDMDTWFLTKYPWGKDYLRGDNS